MAELTHLDGTGAANMVDVSGKAATKRVARAEGRVVTSPETVALIRAGDAKKGDVLGTASWRPNARTNSSRSATRFS